MGRNSTRYPAEVRERAVRLAFEHRGEYGSQWEAMCSIAAKFDRTAETLGRWVRQAERDSGARPGMTTDDGERVKALEREVRDLCQANEILRKASAWFAQAELDCCSALKSDPSESNNINGFVRRSALNR